MKKTIHTLLAAVVGICLAVPAYASAPSTSSELKKPQPEQLAKKGKGKKKNGPPKA